MNILRKIRFQEYVSSQDLLRLIRRFNIPEKRIKIVNVCGSHEHTVCRWGLRSLVPSNIELIPGPGCPVCVTPQEDIVNAIELSKREDCLVATYGDMMRVPTVRGSLRDSGRNLEMLTSCHQVLDVCRRHPEKKVIFFSIGFETTAAPVASLFFMDLPDNLFVLSSHRLTVAAMVAVLDTGPQGFIAPGHVSTVVGSDSWKEFAAKAGVPVVVAGFTPEDVLLAIALLLYRIREGRVGVDNVYSGVVRREGNLKAREMMDKVFEVVDASWRGMGLIPRSGLALRGEFASRDVKRVFEWEKVEEVEEKGCLCSQVILGRYYPSQCSLFKVRCTPSTPVGPCMVSPEGACNIWFRQGSW